MDITKDMSYDEMRALSETTLQTEASVYTRPDLLVVMDFIRLGKCDINQMGVGKAKTPTASNDKMIRAYKALLSNCVKALRGGMAHSDTIEGQLIASKRVLSHEDAEEKSPHDVECIIEERLSLLFNLVFDLVLDLEKESH